VVVVSRTLKRVEIVDVDADEANAIFDRICHAELGVSGSVFMKGYRAGRYADEDYRPEVSSVLAYLPFAAGL
jgi:hypothetical protein